MLIRFAILAGILTFTANAAAQPEPTDAKGLFERGMQWDEKGEFDKAIKDFTEVIRLDPKKADAFVYRGIAWGEKKDYAAAIDDFTEAIRLDPKNALAYHNRGFVKHAKGEPAKAIYDYSTAIRLDPRSASAFSGRAKCWLDTGDFDRGMADYAEAIRLDPKNTELISARGAIWLKAGQFDMAIADFGEAIRINPKDVNALLSRSLCYQFKNDIDSALKDAEEAIRLNPKNALGFGRRGWLNVLKGNYPKALSDLDEAIRLDSKYADALAYRAIIRSGCPDAKMRNAAKALEDAKQACELTNWKVGSNLEAYAAASAAGGNFDDAVKWQKKAMEDPRYMRATGANAKSLLEQYEAKKPFPEAKPPEPAPTDAMGFLARAKLAFENKDYAAAIKDFDEAIRLDPKNAEAFHNRALIRAACPDAKLRDAALALADGQKAVSLSDSEAAFHLEVVAAAYAEAGNYPEAIKWQKLALEDRVYARLRAEEGQKRLKLFESKKPYRLEK